MAATKEMAKEWYEQGEAITNVLQNGNLFPIYSKFIYYWIAFNALYSATDGNNQSEQIEKFIDNNWDDRYGEMVKDGNENKNFFETKRIVSLNPVQRNKKKKINDTTEQMATLATNENPKEKVIALLKCVYQVRCNLFHGEKGASDYDDKVIVRNAAETMSSFLTIYFEVNT